MQMHFFDEFAVGNGKNHRNFAFKAAGWCAEEYLFWFGDLPELSNHDNNRR